jgi:hypothetical protein
LIFKVDNKNQKTMKFKLFLFILVVSSLVFNACDNTIEPADCSMTANTAAQSTNTQIEGMRQAMLAFRGSLSENLRNKATVCLDHERVYTWHNTPLGATSRDGITYGDLDETQLNHFKNLMQLFLSTEGYKKVNEITTLAEGFLANIDNFWNTDHYSIDMFGDPENSGSWGFQLDGHHCVVNFLVHGDQVSIVPAFLGGEPIKETFNGVSFDIFKDERDLALALYNGFTTAENAAAVSTGSSATMLVGPAPNGGDPDPHRGDYDYSGFANGLKYSDMSAATQANLILLMKEYVYNLNTAFADIWWADIMNNIDETYFVWLDNVDNPTPTTQFYYRIYNPYLWVEYNMEEPVGDGIEVWNHAHTITRIPNNPTTNKGGDYNIFAQIINDNGVKTLYEHYMKADHHRDSELPFDYKVKMPHQHKHQYHDHSHDHHHG